MSGGTQDTNRALITFAHRAITFSGGSFQILALATQVPRYGPTTPPAGNCTRFSLFPFRSPLLRESHRFLFLQVLRCFTSLRSLYHPMYSDGSTRCTGGFPHSGISGSKDMCSSPKLIAANHALLRFLMPRHPS